MFYIPAENYDRFEKKLNTIKNKGGEIVLTKGEPQILAVTDAGFADPEIKRGTPAWIMSPHHKFIPVDVEGSYEIPGWEFIGTVEHTPNGNIIRNITDEKIPTKYYHTSPECEHCNKIRSRKDTYLVKNTDTGEFKQIGRTCLRDYTGGLDLRTAAIMAEIIYAPNEFFGDDLSVDGGSRYIDADHFKKVAYNYVKENGYVKDDVKWLHGLIDAYYKSNDLATDEEILKLTDWVNNLDTDNNYFYNASLAWKLNDLEPRHYKLIASLINTYFKDLQKDVERNIKKQAEGSANSEFVGNVKDRITFTVASTRVIYQKTFNYGYNRSSSTDVNRIVGTDGNIYIWASNEIIEVGDTITATVKSHNEYQGEKQTTVIRGKIISNDSKLNLDEN